MLAINYGLAQISRAYGQGAESPTRAVAALLARVKIYYNPHPNGLDSLWFGSIVAWIHCGLHQFRNLRNMCLVQVVQFLTIELIVQLPLDKLVFV